MAAGRTIGCFGLTEPDFGSNPSGMLTTATRVGSGYSITGTKRWITNGSRAQVALVWAKLDGKVRGFLVPTDTSGFAARDIHGEVVAASERDQRARARRGRRRRAGVVARCHGAQGAAIVPLAGAIRPLLRCRRRRDGLLRRGAVVCEGPRTVQPADRRLSARAAEASRDGVAHHGRAARVLAAGASPKRLAPRPRRRRSRWPSATAWRWRANAREMRATSSARTASPTSTSAAATC